MEKAATKQQVDGTQAARTVKAMVARVQAMAATARTARRERVTRHYLDRLLASPRGRAFVLAQAAEAEATDEGHFFDLILAHVADPALAKLVRRHRADELGHAEAFRACLARTGANPGPVPAELRLLERLERALGGTLGHEVRTPREVMEAYLLLQVIEERAVTQFALFEQAFRQHDAETADTFRAIAKDEERHLRYCHAIARRYAPDELTRATTLRRFREIEAKVFAENARANMRHALDEGLVELDPLGRLLWRALGAFAALVGATAPTRFLGDDEERPDQPDHPGTSPAAAPAAA